MELVVLGPGQPPEPSECRWWLSEVEAVWRKGKTTPVVFRWSGRDALGCWFCLWAGGPLDFMVLSRAQRVVEWGCSRSEKGNVLLSSPPMHCYSVPVFCIREATAFPTGKKCWWKKKKELMGPWSYGPVYTFMEEQDLLSSGDLLVPGFWGTTHCRCSNSIPLEAITSPWLLQVQGYFITANHFAVEPEARLFSTFSPRSAQPRGIWAVGYEDSDTGSMCAIASHQCSIASLYGSAWEIEFGS